MSVSLTKITEPLLVGEAPHWDERQQVLFFVSVLQSTIHKYVPTTGAHTRTKLDGPNVGFIIPVEGKTDQFLVGVGKKFLIVQWDGKEGTKAKIVRELGTVDQDKLPGTKINDGKADPRGRVFAGSVGPDESLGKGPNQGSLYRVDKTGITKVVSDIGVSNGLAFDLNRKAFYYVDSTERKVRRYDYDVETGEISNLTYIFDLEKNNVEGWPDGATVDSEGNLWVALFDGSGVIKINPETGKLLQKVHIPVPQVTSLTFGGPKFEDLFVTTASMNIKEEQKPPCGSTYTVTGLGVTGLPNIRFKY